jgi:hypothetical protein
LKSFRNADEGDILCKHHEKLQEEFLAVGPIVTFIANPINAKDISKTALTVE